ncbi:sulfite exporter TauE/SafE family protein [Pseudorhodoferax sp.]|uniref:sulfite exporter TauE/SafE family protein n=1 Tax=Pseudorhodoferax sp. TaxID=1993553 RepID=UPI002DD6B1EF|nr:sulfite exporter TauE/SafE family protein [Pseudorhodoferax sp.]
MAAELGMTALLMGLAGGPHCALMCGAACAGIGRAAAPRSNHALALFHAGRAAGYAAMGALAAWSVQGLGWLGGASAALRPAWSFVHLAAMALGLVLLLQARQPAWLERHGRLLWQRVRSALPWRGGPFAVGLAWSLMPCGLLQAVLLTAALAGDAARGAGAMLAFAAGSALSLWAAPWLVLRLPAPGGRAQALSAWGTRAAGLALLASSAWALWHGLVHDQAPWCLPR